MNRFRTGASVKDKGETEFTCPNCGYNGSMRYFDSHTSVYYICIRVKKLHNKKLAVCPKCKKVFEVYI